MGMPAVLTVSGTASAIWTPDWMQNPFVVGFGLTVATATSTVNVDATYDDPNAVASPHWFTLASTTLTATLAATGTFTSPVQAFRLTIVSGVATSAATCTFVQATFGR